MKKYFNKVILSSILSSLLFIALGVFLLIKPGTANKVIGYTLGAIMLISGITSIIKYFTNKDQLSFFRFELVYGILSTLLSVFIIFNPLTVTGFITILLGLWMTISGTIKIQQALELKRYKEDYWMIALAISILTLILGVLVIFNPFDGTKLITEVVGIFVILYGVLDIVEAILIRRNAKTLIKQIKK